MLSLAVIRSSASFQVGREVTHDIENVGLHFLGRDLAIVFHDHAECRVDLCDLGQEPLDVFGRTRPRLGSDC